MDQGEQLDKWVAGESVHNHETNTCCPDLSCCNLTMDTPMVERERFKEAFYSGDIGTTVGFLDAWLDAFEKHIKEAN